MVIENGDFRLTEKLVQWLEIKGWDQKRLASELSCSESLVCMWLSETPRKPSWQSLKKICLITGLDVGDLLTFDRTLKPED